MSCTGAIRADKLSNQNEETPSFHFPIELGVGRQVSELQKNYFQKESHNTSLSKRCAMKCSGTRASQQNSYYLKLENQINSFPTP